MPKILRKEAAYPNMNAVMGKVIVLMALMKHGRIENCVMMLKARMIVANCNWKRGINTAVNNCSQW